MMRRTAIRNSVAGSPQQPTWPRSRGIGRHRTGCRLATMTPDPVHRGTICQGCTACQAELVDRRMGDYFTVEIDATGRMWAGYSDTRRGGAVALPGFVRQAAGPRFLAR